jgi:hypothetical protein
MMNKQPSLRSIEINPLESGDLGVALHVDNLSGAKLIEPAELKALIKRLVIVM